MAKIPVSENPSDGTILNMKMTRIIYGLALVMGPLVLVASDHEDRAKAYCSRSKNNSEKAFCLDVFQQTFTGLTKDTPCPQDPLKELKSLQESFRSSKPSPSQANFFSTPFEKSHSGRPFNREADSFYGLCQVIKGVLGYSFTQEEILNGEWREKSLNNGSCPEKALVGMDEIQSQVAPDIHYSDMTYFSRKINRSEDICGGFLQGLLDNCQTKRETGSSHDPAFCQAITLGLYDSRPKACEGLKKVSASAYFFCLGLKIFPEKKNPLLAKAHQVKKTSFEFYRGLLNPSQSESCQGDLLEKMLEELVYTNDLEKINRQFYSEKFWKFIESQKGSYGSRVAIYQWIGNFFKRKDPESTKAALLVFMKKKYGLYGEEIFRKLHQDSPFKNQPSLYYPLMADPGVVGQFEQLVQFLKQDPKLELKTAQDNPWELRKALGKFMGTATVYRGMSLTPQEYEAITQKGILTHSLRKEKVMAPIFTQGLQQTYDHHIDEVLQERDTLLSVTSYPDLGVAVSAQYLDRRLSSEKKVYLLPVTVSKLDLLAPKFPDRIDEGSVRGEDGGDFLFPAGYTFYQTTFKVETPDPDRSLTLKSMDLDKEGIPQYQKIESFIPFLIQPEEIDVKGVKVISAEEAVKFKYSM